jgi:hypothetical protein
MRRILVVANQTLGGAQLNDAIDACVEAGPCQFHLLVPATPPAELLASAFTEFAQPGSMSSILEDGETYARERLHGELDRLSAAGIAATGEVGTADPFLAVTAIAARDAFDEILLSTLQRRISRWLRRDLPKRLQKALPIPVRVVSATDDNRLSAKPGNRSQSPPSISTL